jgi:superoxide dismutase
MKSYSTLENLLSDNQVTTYRKTTDGLIAIDKGDHWVYFHYSTDTKTYVQDWCSLTFER